MARALRWDRANIEYANSVAYSNGFIIQAGFVNEGETATVAHLGWTAQHVADFPAEALGFSVAFGMIMGEHDWDGSDVPNAWSEPSADWMYYEVGYYVPALVSSTSGEIAELDYAPANLGGRRTSRSQRRADTGGSNVWFSVSSSGLAPTQSRFYLSMNYSIGILAAP